MAEFVVGVALFREHVPDFGDVVGAIIGPHGFAPEFVDCAQLAAEGVVAQGGDAIGGGGVEDRGLGEGAGTQGREGADDLEVGGAGALRGAADFALFRA